MLDDKISQYQELMRLDKCTFARIEHEDAIVAVVYRVTAPNDVQYILKICSRPSDYLREKYFLEYFSDVLPTPKIIDVVDPSTDIDDAILMQCLPGTLLSTVEVTQELGFAVGAILGRIHDNQASYFGDLIEPNSLNTDPKKHFTFKFEEGLEECENHLPPTVLDKCRKFYDQNIDLLDTVDGPCIIHRDFRPGNILVNNGKLVGIIDWASARAGFAEDDFCPWELGEWGDSAAKGAFLSGYASIRQVPDYAMIMPFLRFNRAVATIGFTVKRGTWDNTSARLYNVNRKFLDELLVRG